MGNKNRKKLLCHGLVLALVCSTAAGATVSDAAKKKAKLAKKSLTIPKGASKKIKIKYKKKKAKYKFKASNKKVKVYKSGKVKALKVGKAKVTVKEVYKKKTRSLGKVTVKVTKKTSGKSGNDNSSQPPSNTNSSNASPTPPTGGTGGNNNSSVPTSTATATATATATPEPTATVIYKNYFEDGDTNGFTGRGGSIEISNEQNHTEGGKNSMLCTGRAATWHGASMDLSKLCETGNVYQFSAWVKQDSGKSEGIAMKVQYNDLDGNTQYKSIIDNADQGKTCASGQWVELSGELTIPDNDGGISMYFECPTSDSIDFLVDDVVIIGKPVDNKTFTPSAAQSAQMAQAGLYSSGNNARLKKVIQKARDGEDVTLAYIGGSITEGALASPNSKCYAQVSATAFGKTYGKDDGSNVHFINAGMSGTPSDIGVIRYQRDVLDRLPEGSTRPDILFIEFAVNDSGCVTAGGAYEGLIREALKSGSAVVLIFSVFKPLNRVCENDYRKYGQHYDLPMISMGDAIKDFYKLDGFSDWYFGDNLHPNNKGYQLMSDCIMKLMDTVDKETAVEDNITDVDAMPAKKTSAYQGIKMIDAATELGADTAITSIEAGSFNAKDSATGNFQYEYNGAKSAPWFPNNWMHKKDSGSDSLKVKVKCKTLMLMYKQSNSTAFGSADLYIDGVKKATLNCYDKSGWNNGKVYLALTEENAADHEIELKMAEGSEAKNFTMLAMGYK